MSLHPYEAWLVVVVPLFLIPTLLCWLSLGIYAHAKTIETEMEMESLKGTGVEKRRERLNQEKQKYHTYKNITSIVYGLVFLLTALSFWIVIQASQQPPHLTALIRRMPWEKISSAFLLWTIVCCGLSIFYDSQADRIVSRISPE